MPSIAFTTSGVLTKSALREANDRLVLNLVRRHPGISRNGIAQRTGFSPPSVKFVVNRLLRSGLVQEAKIEGTAAAGRPPTGLRLRAGAMTVIGVEIAQPESRAVLADLNGRILESRTVLWRKQPRRFLSVLAEAIRSLAAEPAAQSLLSVGVSVPGTINKETGRVVGAESLGWFGVEAGKILGGLLEWPLHFENDANLSALAEQWYAPEWGAGIRYFVYLRLQGGLGSGVVVDGRLLRGHSSSGTEFGHITLYPDGRPCGCGNRGCWEQYASDKALVRAYYELAGIAGNGNPAPVEAQRVIRLARQGDPKALAALRETSHHLGLGMVSLIAALNPEAIVVGEPLAEAWDLVHPVVRAVLEARVPSYQLAGLQLLPSRNDSSSVLRGAAALALRHFFSYFDHTQADAPGRGVTMEAHV